MEKATLIRTSLLVVALVNQFLTANGITPIDEEATANLVATIFTAVTAIWAWWKDNDITKKAIRRKKEIKNQAKKKGKK